MSIFWARFWPPQRARVSETCLYEAWPLVSFFYCGISQKMDLMYQSFSFLQLFSLKKGFLTFFEGPFFASPEA